MEKFIKSRLANVAPHIQFATSREEDRSFKWDGDGPDPRKRGYIPFDITVSASMVVQGELVEGTSHLGGSYYRPTQAIGDIHGYLPQKIDEALADLRRKIAHLPGPLPSHLREIDEAMEFIKQEMAARYAAQRKGQV